MFAIRRFNKEDPIVFGPWSMGRIGLFVNILAIAFCTFLVIFVPFPTILPITAQNMNYAAPIFIGVILLALVDYAIRGHRTYVGPVREVGGSEHSSEIGTEAASGEATRAFRREDGMRVGLLSGLVGLFGRYC